MSPSRSPARLALALAAGYFLLVGLMFQTPNGWLHDGKQPMPTDYLGIYAASLLVDAGRPAAAYDWKAMVEAHATAMDPYKVGRQSTAFFPFPYPPPYLAVAHLLSLPGYVAGALVFLGLTLAGYLVVLRGITRSADGAIYAAASPVTLLNTYIVQNGFLTAGLLGGALLQLQRRPIVAGVLIGLLAMKPQLGVVIPFALVAGGHWRAFAAAAVTIAAAGSASLAAWGFAPWPAFLAHIGTAFDAARNDPICVGKLQTLFGLLANLGAAPALALAAQSILALVSIAAVTVTWRSNAPFELKAAALATGSLLISPYLFIYDFPVLLVAQAFLMRHAARTGWLDHEVAALAGVNGIILAALVLPLPPGLAAVLTMTALIGRRVARERLLPAAGGGPLSMQSAAA